MGFGGITEEGCSKCIDERIWWDTVYRLDTYADTMAEWIVQYKFGKLWRWGEYFGDELAKILKPEENSLVIPIPLHWTRRLWRGFAQAALLAQQIANHHQLHYTPLLRRIKRTKPQTAMGSATKRLNNVKNAFTCKDVNLEGKTVYLVDDVKTTGATATQCAKLLKKHGAEAVHLMVVAVADYSG